MMCVVFFSVKWFIFLFVGCLISVFFILRKILNKNISLRL